MRAEEEMMSGRIGRASELDGKPAQSSLIQVGENSRNGHIVIGCCNGGRKAGIKRNRKEKIPYE